MRTSLPKTYTFIAVSSLILLMACALLRPISRPRTGPMGVATTTPTALPMLAGSTTPLPGEARYTFHINFLMDESVTCSAGSQCDNAYIPRMVLYFLGDLNVISNGSANGEGTIFFTGVDACKTIMPDISSCRVGSVSGGKFAISGRMQGDKLEITMRLTEMPKLAVTMTSQHPSGPVTIPLDMTYQEEMKHVFTNAGIFDVLVQVDPAISTNNSAAYFEGTFTFGDARTLHGYGGMFFIPSDNQLPEEYKP